MLISRCIAIFFSGIVYTFQGPLLSDIKQVLVFEKPTKEPCWVSASQCLCQLQCTCSIMHTYSVHLSMFATGHYSLKSSLGD